MEHYVVWFVLGFLLLVAELLTGTFYLLMIGIGFGAGGVAALAGANEAAQLSAAAIVALALTIVLRRSRFSIRRLAPATTSAAVEQLDVGQSVDVDAWHQGRARVQYRGTQWDAVPEDPATPPGRGLIIKSIRGSVLVLGSNPHL